MTVCNLHFVKLTIPGPPGTKGNQRQGEKLSASFGYNVTRKVIF